jgi:hypothetical protein
VGNALIEAATRFYMSSHLLLLVHYYARLADQYLQMALNQSSVRLVPPDKCPHLVFDAALALPVLSFALG